MEAAKKILSPSRRFEGENGVQGSDGAKMVEEKHFFMCAEKQKRIM